MVYLWRIACSHAIVAVMAVAATGASQGSRSEEPSCSSLAGASWWRTTLTSAVEVEASDTEPAHCRVEGSIRTGCAVKGTNEVRFRAWLPRPWNGKLYMVGGGGFAGGLPDGIPALSRQYATLATDTGHRACMGDASWARDNPAAVVDFGHRGVHVTVIAGKRLIKRYYGEGPRYSYFEGCSRGGGQGMMESQRYPQDFDGIIAGAPAHDWPRFMTLFAHTQKAMYPVPFEVDDPAPPALPLSKLSVIEQAVDAKCDALDGVVDGLVDDPRECPFDPEVDIARCPANAPACLTEDEVEIVKAIYQGASSSSGQIYPGFPVGSEADPLGWAIWMVRAQDVSLGPTAHYVFADQFFGYLAFPDNDDGSFGLHDFDPEAFGSLRWIGKVLNATDTDLERFARRGGKIIFWNGWSDPAQTALATIRYYESLSAGRYPVDGFSRLYLAPGMQHCFGGEGPNAFDMLTALEDWVERDAAPAEVIARNPVTGRTRPLCPYPQVARYDGDGSTDDAANFNCVAP